MLMKEALVLHHLPDLSTTLTTALTIETFIDLGTLDDGQEHR